MPYSTYIETSDPAMREALADYENSIASLALSQKLYDCQKLSEKADETSTLKVLLLFLVCEDEVKHEIKRIVSWNHSLEKARLLVEQLASQRDSVVMGAVEILGALREALAIPPLGIIFDMGKTELAKHIIIALSEIDRPMGSKIMARALQAEHRETVLLAIEKLSDQVEDVPWKSFRKLLHHGDPGIREEAFFAITMRKAANSAPTLLHTIEHEADIVTRRRMIQHLGSVPNARILLPMLDITARDPSQKMRMTASRAIDRLQGILDPDAIFDLRKISDIDIKTEVTFRLGKFGSDRERHKNYLRRTLVETDDMRVRQACIQALGYIADHSDMELLSGFLRNDPVTTYNATMALTRVWRMEDGEKVVDAMLANGSATQKQILLKYATRRRGMLLPAETILYTVKRLLEGEDNISVRYLSFAFLKYAPSSDTLQFIISSYSSTDNEFELETLRNSLKGISALHGEEVVRLVTECNQDTCCMAIPLLPTNLSASIYSRLAKTIFKRHRPMADGAQTDRLCSSVFELLNASPTALREFVLALPDEEWKGYFLKKLAQHAAPESLDQISDLLIGFLYEPDANIRKLAIGLILSLKNPAIVPSLISVSEGDAQEEVKDMARDAAKTLVEEWMR